MGKTVVPWKNPNQFKKVYEYAYSQDIAKKRWAVEQMSVWETRCWPSLPTAVEATLLLVRSKIQDTLFEADKSLCQARDVEMMYSTSIIRFVNLFVEMDRNTLGKLKMSEVAEKRNIPAWIIDVRHNTTHGHNPTLPVFRMAYKTIMEYLEEVFWIPETARVCSIKKIKDQTSTLEVFQEYKAVQTQEVLNKYPRKESYHTHLDAVLKKLEMLLSKPDSRKKLLEILVHPEYFITQEDVLDLVKYDQNFLKDTMEVLPERVQKFWLPMIEILHKHDCIPIFLELLLLSQKDRRVKIFQKVADALVLYILNLMILRPGSVSIGQSIFLEKGALIEWKKLLYSCVLGSSDFSQFVFKRIASELEWSIWIEELFSILSINKGLTIEEKPGKASKRKFDITFTADDLEDDMLTQMRNTNAESKKNPWSFAPVSIDFSNKPLGHVFHPVELQPKEDLKQVIESLPIENIEPVYEESKILEVVKSGRDSSSFIFCAIPTDGFMIYRKKTKMEYKTNV